MSNILQIENFGAGIVIGSSSLAADYTSGTTIVPKNVSSMATNQYLLVGRPGDESTELGQIDAVAAPNVTLHATLAYPHAKYAELLVLAANQIRIYSAANVNGTVPPDGSFNAINTINIQADSLTTYYNDPTGGNNVWYKYTYYNSVTDTETPLSDAIAVRGGTSGYYTSIYSIRRDAGMLNNSYIADTDIATYRLRAQSTVNSSISNRYTVPLTTPVADIIENITTMLASGYLLLSEYGAQAQGSSKDGQAKIDQATKMLADLQAGNTEIFDSSGNTLMQSTIGGWPDDSTASLGETDQNGNQTAGGQSIFTISHRY